MEAHEAAVSAISTRVQIFYQKNTPFRLYHGSTNSTRHRKVDRNQMIDTSGLNHVLGIDWEKKTCLVEPNVAMDELVNAVMPHGLLPPVVMEFPGITVGGGFAGTAGESSGFRYGFFDSTINWIEVVLPTGEIVTASPDKLSDLFYGAAGTFGTLGVTTLFEIQLVDSKSYVELTYHPVTSVADALSTIQTVTRDSTIDYVDGILFSLDRGVVVTGRLTDQPLSHQKYERFSRAQDPWFYIHVDRTASRQMELVKEITPTRDYLFRYDRGAVRRFQLSYITLLVSTDSSPFSLVLDGQICIRLLYDALQSCHALGAGLLHAHPGDVPCIACVRSRIEVYRARPLAP